MTNRPTPPPDALPAADIEYKLRYEWWLNHGVNCRPYGDDGEMQCCGIDFKRTPLIKLEAIVHTQRMARLRDALSPPQPPADAPPDDPWVLLERARRLFSQDVCGECGQRPSSSVRCHECHTLRTLDQMNLKPADAPPAPEPGETLDAYGDDATTMEQIKGHWFSQGGEAQFGSIRDAYSAEEIVVEILRVVRRQFPRPDPPEDAERLRERLTPSVYRAAEEAWDSAYAAALRTGGPSPSLSRALVIAHDAWRTAIVQALAARPDEGQEP